MAPKNSANLDIDWIALYGAFLSTALAASGLYRWIRAKPERRFNKVRIMLEKMISSIAEVDVERNTFSIQPLVDAVRVNKGKIIGLEALFQKTGAADIWKDLMKLIDLVRMGTEGMFNHWDINHNPDVLWKKEDALVMQIRPPPPIEGVVPISYSEVQ